MADDQDKDSKTEQPTEKKLRDAIEKGNVPFSREVPIFASSLAIFVYLVFFAPGSALRLVESLKDIFEKPDEWRLETGADAMYLFGHVFWQAGAALLPAFALLVTFGLSASILQNAPLPALERVRPQLSRVSPIKGFGRIFGIQGMVDFAKSLTKILIVSAIVGFAMKGDFIAALSAMFSEPSAVVGIMAHDAGKVLLIIVFATATIAIADLLWTRHHWFSEQKMTRQELKDEFKQTDGDPILKARQRSLARDRARKRMMAAVPRATMVIANPTHFAVALRYVREEGGAPVVVAKGQDLVALKIREIAEANGIPVFEDPPLARSMFAQVSVDSFIPPAFYKAVAELVHKIYASTPQSRRAGQTR